MSPNNLNRTNTLNALAGGLYGRAGGLRLSTKSQPARAFCALWTGERRLQSATLMAALLLLTALVGVALAETEVSGEVSGEWTVEGSPFIVVDSTWVPEGSNLEISEGVEILIAENVGIWVYGSIQAHGTEEEAVVFDLIAGLGDEYEPDEIGWAGIYLGENSTNNEFAWTQLSNTLQGFRMDNYSSLTMSHSKIYALKYGIKTPDQERHRILRGQRITLTNCSIRAKFGLAINSGLISIDSSEVWGVSNSMGWLTITNSTIRGKVGTSSECLTRYTNCLMYPAQLDTNKMVAIGGSNSEMVDCHVFGDVAIAMGSSHTIDNCIIEGDLEADYFGGRIMNTVIQGYERVKFHNFGNTFISNCTMSGINACPGSAGTLTLENTTLIGVSYFTGQEGEEFNVIIKKCVILDGLRITATGGSVRIENNTIIARPHDRPITKYALHIQPGLTDLIVRNNILLSDSAGGVAFFRLYVNLDDIDAIIQYNDFWGWDSLFNDYDQDVRLDETNIEADPLLVSLDSLDVELQWGSPCIDAGDPNSPEDPDGTRADIGAVFYRQHENSIHPYHKGELILDFRTYPNPFNSTLNIDLSTIESQPLVLSLTDISGRTVKTLFNGKSQVGENRLSFEILGIPSEIYFLQITSGGFRTVRPIVLVR